MLNTLNHCLLFFIYYCSHSLSENSMTFFCIHFWCEEIPNSNMTTKQKQSKRNTQTVSQTERDAFFMQCAKASFLCAALIVNCFHGICSNFWRRSPSWLFMKLISQNWSGTMNTSEQAFIALLYNVKHSNYVRVA